MGCAACTSFFFSVPSFSLHRDYTPDQDPLAFGSGARAVQRNMYFEAFEACKTKFGASTCIRADAENRKTGKFMCPYNKKTGATIFRDESIVNWADSDCQNYEVGYYNYRGWFFQDLKDWLVEHGRGCCFTAP